MDNVTQTVTTRLVNLHDLQGPAATRQQDLRRVLTQMRIVQRRVARAAAASGRVGAELDR